MAKLWYANTHYKDLLSSYTDSSSGDAVGEETINRQVWLKVPRTCSANIILAPSGLYDVYFSCEMMCLGYTNSVYANEHRAAFIDGDSRYQNLLSWHENGNIDFYRGSVTNAEYPVTKPVKLFFHSSANKVQLITSVANYGEKDDSCTVRGFSFSGVCVRNIIVSEENMVFSDTIREVPIESITGADWQIATNSAYTEDTNVSATVSLDAASMKKQRSSIDPRKLIVTGISERQGENITGIDVKRGYETHLQKIDVGSHVFGTAYDTSKDDTNTNLTITTRSV